MTTDWKFVTPAANSFVGVPVCTDLDKLQADIALLGVHYISPYPQIFKNIQLKDRSEEAPAAIRRQSSVFADKLHHHNFDFDDGDTLAGKKVRVVDCGDVDRDVEKEQLDPKHITLATKKILEKGAVPIIMGTDEGSCIFAMRAYEGFKSVCVVHLDAHIDWRMERDGVTEGYSNVMRRTSEMPWIDSMVQVGLRGIGSARPEEIKAAREFGSVFIRARDLHQQGVAECAQRIPKADHYIISIDSDVFESAIAPGVLFNAPGGITYDETTSLIQEITGKGKIMGINIFELRPERDINGLTASTIAQMMINFIGSIAHSNQL